MKVTETQFQVGKSRQGLVGVQATGANLQPIAQGVSDFGNSLARVAAEQKAKDEQMKRFKATASLVDYNTQVDLEQDQFRKQAAPDDTAFAMKAVDLYVNKEADFLKTLPPDLQEEFKVRVADTRQRVTLNAYDFQDKQLTNYYTGEVNKRGELAAADLAKNPDAVETWRADLTQMIARSDMSKTAQIELKQKVDEFLETSAYRSKTRENRLTDAQYADDLVTATRQAAYTLGADPIDLLTVMSFETGGTFSTGQKGGAGGRHIGLIQFGPEEAKKYGVHEGQTVAEQMQSVVAYLKDRGYKPGMNLMDLYSTINAGKPGLYAASDAKNGGTPGTVADKVNNQMAEHRANAIKMLDGKYVIPDQLDNDPRFANVPYEARIAARNDTNTEVNQMMAQMKEERKAKTDAFNNELYKQLEYGPLGNGNKLIDDALAAGYLTDYNDLHRATEIVKTREKEVESQSLFFDKLAKHQPLDYTDSDNKKNMNKLFGQQGLDALNNRDEGYVNGTLAPLFKDTQMIPPDALGQFDALARSNDGRQVLYSMKALGTLESVNPDAYAVQVNEGLRAKVDRFNSLNGKVSEEELLASIRGPRTIEERNAVASRREEIKKIITSPRSPVSFDSVSEAFGGAAIPDGVQGDAMRNDWQSILIEKYASGGVLTVEEANAETVKEFQRRYGVSNIGGPVVMRHPPEMFEKDSAGDKSWMEVQLRGETGIAPDEKPLLIPDMQTEYEVNQGKKPSYQVWTVKNGHVTQLKKAPPAGWEQTGYRFGAPPPAEPLRFQFEQTQQNKEANDAHTMYQNKEAELAHIRELTMPYPFGKAEAQGAAIKPIYDIPGSYGDHTPGNINLMNRPQVKNGNDISTVLSASYENNKGETVLIPLVSNEGKIMDVEEAVPYWGNKGQNLGVFRGPNARENATKYAENLHHQQEGLKTYVGKDGSRIPVPTYLLDRRAQLEAELGHYKAVAEEKKAASATQYDTPATIRYKELDRQISPILNELTAFTGLSEDFPRLKELEDLMAEQEKLKPVMAAEALNRRSQGAQ